MPTYQQSSYLEEAIDSVLAQTYKNWELIIVDNYSSDNTEGVALRSGDRRIRYFKFANNGIIAASRNFGLSQANGEYAAFLDSDDIWLPEKLSRSVTTLQDGIDLVCHSMTLFDVSNNLYPLKPYNPDLAATPFISLLQRGNFIFTSTVVARLSVLLPGFDVSSEIVTAEDYDLWLRLFSTGGVKCAYLKEPLTRYRIHDANNSSKVEQHSDAVIRVAHKWIDKSGSCRTWKTLREASVWYTASRRMAHQGKRTLAFKYIVKSLLIMPSSAKSWVALFTIGLPSIWGIHFNRFLIRVSEHFAATKGNAVK
jgi:glycosyltransferase involved in cell wall biosynthesis